ncbi:SUMF1/EgtB/PvdO family nonheme iron enzyme [Oceanobacillus sp. CF4.6]|uniref:SUMF1/EgtB/PvdO family nonheme iron enzyme n=1 Tax=Oceanobacillus sp. CF4.6 TaxID=3373080 RepID=UPI003EE562D5
MPFILSIKDTYRQAVEAATDGKNTVMYDDKGNPSIMVCIPRFNLSDVIDGAPDTPHPAFIVDGVVKSEIWISKFQNIVHDSRAYSLPGMDPHTYVDFDQAKQYSVSKGTGWHLMSNAEWAAIALWAKKNGTMPRGNNNYGKDHSAPYERGRETAKSGDQTGRVATGSGPASWSHDGTNAGIFDLNGNVWEWNDGLKLVDGKIYVHQDNNFNTPEDILQWVDTGAFFDVESGNLVINGSRTYIMDEATSESKSRTFETLAAYTGYTIPELLKHLAIAPIDANHGGDYVYARNYSERIPLRGGDWLNGAHAGVFSLNLYRERSYSGSSIGFRSALVL